MFKTSEFRTFLLRGNVVDLAVGIMIGAAFKGVIDSFLADILNPLIAAVGGKTDFTEYAFTVNGASVTYGNFISVLLSFLITAAVIFYLIIQPMNRMHERRTTQAPPPESTTRPCPRCLTEIPKAATRCASCTSDVPAVA
ncbi:MAG: large conductance mechanosensitive channel protein MscL [Chloroflexi bacterium]|nr:large conductance mechanosensitive channel protein MscL [Chloroflexota bacterium]MDA1240418.1 large conductance mechanosensitive channel protein MscL [Chloroflexota bacterium]